MKRTLTLLSLSLFACGPSVTTLVAQHRWDESVCAVSDEREAELAIPAIVDAAHARFVVHEIKREDLGPIDDATLGDFFTRHAVYAIDTRADPTSTTVERIDGSIQGASAMRYVQDFTAFTAEKFPEDHTTKETVLTNAAPSKAFWAVMTVGLSLLVDDRPMTQTVDRQVPPSHEEVVANAPRAVKLANAFAAPYATMPHFVVSRGESPVVEIVVEVNNDSSCSARATYHARLDSVKPGEWTNVKDTQWSSLHTTGDHVVDVDR